MRAGVEVLRRVIHLQPDERLMDCRITKLPAAATAAAVTFRCYDKTQTTARQKKGSNTKQARMLLLILSYILDTSCFFASPMKIFPNKYIINHSNDVPELDEGTFK